MGESEYHTLPISFNPISAFADVVSEKKQIAEVVGTAEQDNALYPFPEPAPYCRLAADVNTVKPEEITGLYQRMPEHISAHSTMLRKHA